MTGGWDSPSGIAVFITAITGISAFIWSVITHRKKDVIDIDKAIELMKLMRDADDDDPKPT